METIRRVGSATLILVGCVMSLEDDIRIGRLGVMLALIGVVAMMGMRSVRAVDRCARPSAEAYELGYAMGYDKGRADGRAQVRPVVVPLQRSCAQCQGRTVSER